MLTYVCNLALQHLYAQRAAFYGLIHRLCCMDWASRFDGSMVPRGMNYVDNYVDNLDLKNVR